MAHTERMQVTPRSTESGIECMLVFVGMRSRDIGVATVEGRGSTEEDIERVASTIEGMRVS